MANERRYTRIPPESTGDRVQMNWTVDVPYENKIGIWVSGTFVTLADSGFSGTIVRIREDTPTSGLVSFRPEQNSEDNNISPQIGDPIQLNGVTIGNVANGQALEIYTPVQKIVGWDDTFNGLNIDKQGAAQTRFTEGAPTIDAFGAIRTAQSQPIGDYVFAQSALPSRFTTETTGGGTLTWSQTDNAIVLQTTLADGDTVAHTSDQYHHAIPGQSQLILMTIATGDSGKANLTRCWGYFDDNNGAFFKLDGTDLSVVIRSNVGGSVNDITIPQAEWNADNGTGTGGEVNTTGLDLDPSLANIYWIDVQGINGRVRFGVFYEGQRLVLHEQMISNRSPVPAFKTTRLPVSFRQINNGAVGSTSQMKVWSSAVFVESDVNLVDLGAPAGIQGEALIDGTPQQLIAAVRPQTNLANGNINHNAYFPIGFNIGCWDDVTKDPGFIRIEVFFGGAITGGTWDQPFGSTAEINTTGTVGAFGVKLSEWFVQGTNEFEIEESFTNAISGAVRNKADGTQTLYFFVATRISGSNDVRVGTSVQWKEIEN